DIYAIQQSVHTPIKYALCGYLKSAGKWSVGTTLSSIHTSLAVRSAKRRRKASKPADSDANLVPPSSHYSARPQSLSGKDRPCIIATMPSVETEDVMGIFVMATYDDTPLQEMPAIYRHFSLAVYPNEEPSHVHTMPEWHGKGIQWVIAVRYTVPRESTSTGNISRWCNEWYQGTGNKQRVQRSHHRFETTTLSYLRRTAEEKMEQWQEMCRRDPELATRMADACEQPEMDEDGYRLVISKKRKAHSRGSSFESGSSYDSGQRVFR
ncbi:hypothetical protein EVJ58_g9382, partial [Rhodofomes roseus]